MDVKPMSEPNIYSVPLNYTPPVLPKFKLPPQNFGEKVISDIIHEHKVDIEYITWIETVRKRQTRCGWRSVSVAHAL